MNSRRKRRDVLRLITACAAGASVLGTNSVVACLPFEEPTVEQMRRRYVRKLKGKKLIGAEYLRAFMNHNYGISLEAR